MAQSVTADCGYRIGMGAMMYSMIFVPNSVPHLETFCFAHTNSTNTNTNPHGTEASAADRSGRACVARAVIVERGGMGERRCAGRLGGLVWV